MVHCYVTWKNLIRPYAIALSIERNTLSKGSSALVILGYIIMYILRL